MVARRIAAVMVALALFVVPLTACSGSTTPPPATPDSGQGSATPGGGSAGGSQGQQLVETKCKMCHSLDRVQQADKTAEEWEQTVSRMQRNGLVVTDDEKSAILDYLSNK